MTEQEWKKLENPHTRLEFVREAAGERKIRLLAVACCRRIWHLLDETSRVSVDAAEQHADGRLHSSDMFEVHVATTTRAEQLADSARHAHTHHFNVWGDLVDAGTDASAALMAAERASARYPIGLSAADHRASALPLTRHGPGKDTVHHYAILAVAHAASPLNGPYDAIDHDARSSAMNRERSEQIKLIDDIFGNPFRPVSISPEWRTSTAVAIANGMYESRDFGPMPLLADALQDAGCEESDIIDHCRGAGPHIRGCWVVDGVLGKS